MKIIIFGDSHSQYFTSNQTLMQMFGFRSLFEQIECHVLKAATVRGFGKRESTLNIKEKLLEKIDENIESTVVLNFGQVDIELGLYYKKFVKNEEQIVDEFIEECILAYQVLIDLLKDKVKYIIIKGLNYPVLIDQSKAIRYVGRIIIENIKDASLFLKCYKNI